jgi:hypothetical protein
MLKANLELLLLYNKPCEMHVVDKMKKSVLNQRIK